MTDLPALHLPFRTAFSGRTTPESRQHSFDDSPHFNTVPPEISNHLVTRVGERSRDLWLMDMRGTTSQESSSLSISPSLGIATPPADGFYSQPYPDQLHLPTHELLEQPQPLRSCSTSHPNWVESGENLVRNYPYSDIRGTQPVVAQPWIPSPYNCTGPLNMAPSHAYANDGALSHFTYASQVQFSAPEAVQARSAATNEGSPVGEENNEKEDSSDEESDSDEERSKYIHTKASATRPKPKTRSSRPHVDTWTVFPVNSFHCPENRGFVCDEPKCGAIFARPEHLRRHVKSKHTDEKNHGCKVDGCKKQFTRGDNLRDHYWTHVEHGGCAGTNRKMSIPELEVILGPTERSLVRNLQMKLRLHKEKEKQKKQ